jgi:hypothetical protein
LALSRPTVWRACFLAAALAVSAVVAKGWPKDQTVHYVLGDAAPRVEEIDARWAERRGSPSGDPVGHGGAERTGQAGDEWAREVSFRYAPGRAPRVVTHAPRLPDGDYTVEIEIVASDSERSRRAVVRRHVYLAGGVTSIDLARSTPGLE